MSRADSVGSLEFRTASIIGTSRGPSPLTIGMTDTIPLAVAFHEIIHAYFRLVSLATWPKICKFLKSFEQSSTEAAMKLDVR